jgi:hypothetical protein
VDRFFRGIGNRFRGVREEETVDSGFSAREEVIDAQPDLAELRKGNLPSKMAASDQSDAGSAGADTPLSESSVAGTVDEAADTSSSTEDDDETITDSMVEDDANTDDDTGSDDAPAPDGDDDGATVTITDGSGSIVSGGDGTTITITDGDGTTITGDGAATWITISDGSSDDGSIIITNPVDTESGSDDSAEPPQEPEREPHPEPEPEPEPQPDSDDVVSVGGGRDVDEVIVIDGATPVEGDRPTIIRPERESGAETSESISAAEAVRAGLIAPEDLRVQSNIEFRGNLAGLITSDDEDDDDDAMLAPRDEFIEIPKVENQPAPGSGPPNPQPVGEARLIGDQVVFQRDGIENPGSTLPPVPEGGTTYSAFSASADSEEDTNEEEQDQSSTSTQVVGIVDQDGNVVWHENGWWATTDDPEGEPIWRPGPSGDGPSVDDGVWDGGGYWTYLDDEVVWVPGPDGEGPSGDPPEYSPSPSADFGSGDPFNPDATGATYDDDDTNSGSASSSVGYWSYVEDEFIWVAGSDGAGPSGDPPQWPNQDGEENPMPTGGYFLMPVDADEVPIWYPGPDGSVPSGTEGYWAYVGGEVVWVPGPDGEGPSEDPPPWPTLWEESADSSSDSDGPHADVPASEYVFSPGEDDEAGQPVYEPLPQYTIGDPISSGGQPAGISSADLLASAGPDIVQYIDTDRLQERQAQNGEDDVPAPDEIERPAIKLERAPGEGPPQVGSLDVMDTTARFAVVTDGDTRSDTEEEEDLQGLLQHPDIGNDVGLVGANLDTSNIFDTNPEDGTTRNVSILDVEDTKMMAGDSEAGEPSKTVDSNTMAGDSEAGEPSQTIEPMQSVEIAQGTPLEFVEAPEIARIDVPIDFQTTPVIEQQPKVAEVETAIPAAVDPQPAISPVQPNFPVEVQPLVNNENITEWELKSHAGDPADDDDPLDGM